VAAQAFLSLFLPTLPDESNGFFVYPRPNQKTARADIVSCLRDITVGFTRRRRGMLQPSMETISMGQFAGTSHGLIQNVPRQLPDGYVRMCQTPFEQEQVVRVTQACFGKGQRFVTHGVESAQRETGTRIASVAGLLDPGGKTQTQHGTRHGGRDGLP
jgi:hypothetical protein